MKPNLEAEFFAELGLTPHAEAIRAHTLLSRSRIQSLALSLRDLPEGGQTAEIGCLGGGTTRLIVALNGGRQHWACDTFCGLMDVAVSDGDLRNGDFRIKSPTAENEVRSRLSDLRVNVVGGYFPESATPEMREARYAFVHLDVDTYRSMRAAFAFFVDRMLPRGVMALDDVIGRGTSGAKKAWTELQRTHGKRFEVLSSTDPQVIVRFK